MNALKVDIGGEAWTVEPGQRWVVTGPAASGKTWVAAQLARRYPDDVALVTFGAQAAAAGTDWAGARWYASVGYDSRTVAETLTYEAVNDISPFEVREAETAEHEAFAWAFDWARKALLLDPLLERQTLQLSNGEQRRVMLARAILRLTPALALDDPFAGLDPTMQHTLRDALDELAGQGRTLIVTVRNEDEIPPCTTHRLRLRDCAIESQGPCRPPKKHPQALSFRKNPPSLATPCVLRLRDLHLETDGRDLFKGLDWEVHEGERWLVVGPNGSGKSTLLSLILGDNPMAYACDVERFGARLGPGVPLWSVRSRMALVSPELQAFADPGQTVEAAVYSGLFDREGQRKRPTPEQRKTATALLTALGLYERRKAQLGTLSDGMARLALVIRALVPAPDLLLLDELCMNLEDADRDRLLRLLGRLLDETPALTVICVAHRPDHVPPGFNRVLKLGGDHA